MQSFEIPTRVIRFTPEFCFQPLHKNLQNSSPKPFDVWGKCGKVIYYFMSARKIQASNIINAFPVTVQARQTCLSLSPDQVRIRKNGVEFLADSSIAAWTEMTVTLQSNRDAGRVQCTGVVVSCNGNKHSGYVVSMVFTNLSRQSQERLNMLAVP